MVFKHSVVFECRADNRSVGDREPDPRGARLRRAVLRGYAWVRGPLEGAAAAEDRALVVDHHTRRLHQAAPGGAAAHGASPRVHLAAPITQQGAPRIAQRLTGTIIDVRKPS